MNYQNHTRALKRVSAKPGLWTLDWTHGLDCGLNFGLTFGLKCACASLALARCRTYGVCSPSVLTQSSLLSQNMSIREVLSIFFFAYSVIQE